jgi:hypothetical protein
VTKKISRATGIAALAAIICDALSRNGITAFLSGGAVVSIYTENKYQSFDLDFITHADRSKIDAVMISLGFSKDRSRMYSHPNTEYTVEFPGSAALVGDQPIRKFSDLKFPQGTLRLLTPTDCVKDRLAAYYHWNDRQGLNQAVAVAEAQPIKLSEIKRWSEREGMGERFRDFLSALRSRARSRQS